MNLNDLNKDKKNGGLSRRFLKKAITLDHE
jgi:hypothetical protein